MVYIQTHHRVERRTAQPLALEGSIEHRHAGPLREIEPVADQGVDERRKRRGVFRKPCVVGAEDLAARDGVGAVLEVRLGRRAAHDGGMRAVGHHDRDLHAGLEMGVEGAQRLFDPAVGFGAPKDGSSDVFRGC